jgi:putative membrane protein
MTASNDSLTTASKSLVPQVMLGWYAVLFVSLAISPFDSRIWWGSNILPVAFVAVLVLTHRTFPLSNTSYVLITLWLTLHLCPYHLVADAAHRRSALYLSQGAGWRLARPLV